MHDWTHVLRHVHAIINILYYTAALQCSASQCCIIMMDVLVMGASRAYTTISTPQTCMLLVQKKFQTAMYYNVNTMDSYWFSI